MRRAYYSGGVGELLFVGDEPVKLADIEEASILLDYAVRPLCSERDYAPVAVVAGPGTGTVSCVVRGFVEGNPLMGLGQAKAFKRAVRFSVPSEEPFRIILPEEPVPESLVVETPDGDAFVMAGLPSPGKFSYKLEENALYFSREDAGREVLVSYVYGDDGPVESPHCREIGLVLVFPALGRKPSGDPAFRVIEARRVVLSSWSEEFASGGETMARAVFVLLSDEDGFIIRERMLEALP